MATHWGLRFIHVLYTAFVVIAAWVQRCQLRKPKPLKAQRSKVPKHLCLNLVANDDMPVEKTKTAFLQCLQSVVPWCRVLGIDMLTVYDRHGVLDGYSGNAPQSAFATDAALKDSRKREIDSAAPLFLESSGSRKSKNQAHNGVHSASNDLVVYIASRDSGKPAVVSATRLLLQDHVNGTLMSNDSAPCKCQYNLTAPKLATVLEADLPPPQFMIIHHIGGIKLPHPPIEFHGFPPWHNTLAEFHRTHPDDGIETVILRPGSSVAPRLISEEAFCRALDEYAAAEFRLGR